MSRNDNLKRKRNKLNIRFIPALIIAIAVFVSMTMVGPVNVRAAAESTIAFSQGATISVTNGDNFTLTPTINTGTNAVSIVALRITFDQTRVALDSITPSTTFGTAESATAISNTNGTASVDLSVGNANPSVTGTYAVATLNFHAIATGDASVAFTGAAGTTGAAADGETGDVIITRTGATVTVDAGTDTTAPTLSNGSPSGALAAGTTQTTVSLSTNEAATCKFSQTTGVAYASMTGTFTTTGGTSHSMTAAGLTNGTSYNYYVRCNDTSGNPTTSDYAISFSVSNATITSSDDNDDGDSHKKEKEKKKKRKITNSKSKVSRGQVLTQRGKRFSKKSIVLLYFSKPGGGYYTPMKIMTSASGAFVTTYKVNKPAGKYSWYAVDQKTGKKSKVVTYSVR